jgi:hypothetical protein
LAIEALTAVIVIDCSPTVAILKFTPVCEAPFTETFWLVGLKLTPVLLGVTV